MAETVSYPFTSRTYVSVAIARGIAAANGHADVTAAHLALGIIQEGANMAAAALQRSGVHLRHLRHLLESELPPQGRPHFGEVLLPTTPGERELIQRAADEVEKLKTPYLADEHLLLAMLYDRTTPIAQFFAREGITYETIWEHLQVIRSGGI
jgi:ATP-dependent Clp protease ATP-binding subunit ClpA